MREGVGEIFYYAPPLRTTIGIAPRYYKIISNRRKIRGPRPLRDGNIHEVVLP